MSAQTRPTWVPVVLVVLSVALVIAAVRLGTHLADELRDDPVDVLAAGETLLLESPPYAEMHTVIVPLNKVDVAVGRPLDSLDHEFIAYDKDDSRRKTQRALHAPEGGSLVPVSWSIRPTGGLASGLAIATEIRLVAGGEKVTIGSVRLGDPSTGQTSYEQHDVVVALPGDLDTDDLKIEVEFGGQTQVLDVATGEIDAGVAQALYEPEPNFDASCHAVEDNCQYVPASADQQFHPIQGRFTASQVTLYPWDAELGWADEGTLWAGVRISSFSALGTDAAGNVVIDRRQAPPRVTLDGRPPVGREGLKGGEGSTSGRAILRVEADDEPKLLRIQTVITLGNGVKMPVEARLPLQPVTAG
ncbi:hypothetical protein [Nocardioides sp. Root151]|uniref:hypothetical protein n=1 Tax=Nocardioides sp. Root151 TaxID=1736475 RepID=UPI000703B0E9|nr:hypothetical protein [Nocardioides sp. Root151]KQZ70661.1 hypothetical protein ASD66_13875 [Nocardioides sp. Root151]